jgi:hypothetical protein
MTMNHEQIEQDPVDRATVYVNSRAVFTGAFDDCRDFLDLLENQKFFESSPHEFHLEINRTSVSEQAQPAEEEALQEG